MSALTNLSSLTTIVADTADFELLKKHPVTDATTNPSLILAASQTSGYTDIMAQGKAAIAQGRDTQSVVQSILAKVGQKILEIVPGRVSAEVDARLSFDTQATISYAYKLIEAFAELGVDQQRVLIKIASTWEGLAAAKYLEEQNIHCNMTLIFHHEQALVAAENGATLVSPFVGRILDFYKANNPDTDYSGAADPGVRSVQDIYASLKGQDYKTQIMAASFRNTDQIFQLAGTDLMTISPSLLDELNTSQDQVNATLKIAEVKSIAVRKSVNHQQREAAFRWQMNQDPMSTTKLADGIRRFAADQVTFEKALIA